MILTRVDIENDIKNYQARISAAQSKLTRLPSGYLSFAENKKREAARRELLSEIQHVERLIEYAKEVLDSGFKKRKGGKKMKFREHEKKIVSLESEIERCKVREVEAQKRINEGKKSIDDHKAELKTSLINDDGKKVTALSENIGSLQQQIYQDNILIEALDSKGLELDAQLADAKKNRDETFSKLAEAWLKKEIVAYDEAAVKVIEKIQRLFVARDLLKDCGHSNVYIEAVGPGHDFLPNTKIAVLKNFDRSACLGGRNLRAGKSVYNQVNSEILKQ